MSRQRQGERVAARIEVRKHKWPDRLIDRAVEEILGEDEHGSWRALPARREIQSQDGAVFRFGFDVVACYPPQGWWIATFHPDVPLTYEVDRPAGREVGTMRPREIYTHIAMPPSVHVDGWQMFMDLELDVIRHWNGDVVVIDEDDFAAVDLPDDIRAQARASCDEVARMMRAREEPFGDVGPRWLARFAEGTA